MKVIRDGQVLYSNASGCGASNADDCGCGCKDNVSNAGGPAVNPNVKKTLDNISKTDTSSSAKKGINPDVLKAGTDILGQLGTALIGRQRTYTDVEQKCGKKPIGKKKLAEWNKCASSADISPAGAPIPTSGGGGDVARQGLSKGAKIGIAVGGLVVVGLVIFLVVKSGKSKGK